MNNNNDDSNNDNGMVWTVKLFLFIYLDWKEIN